MPEMIASTYEIIEKIGSGGGGNVFLAYHVRLGKKVVLKADKRKITTKPELLRREVDILKELNHPYIPRVYDFFAEGDTVYTVMDYIEGESLDRPLKRGERFSQSQVITWACELLEALSYLHSPTHGEPPRGFVHSDIKPANLMRTRDGHICLIDFNIALALGEENVIGCSAGYASPEHYGLDYSSKSALGFVSDSHIRENEPKDEMATVLMADDGADSTLTVAEPNRTETFHKEESASSQYKKVVPDVRSDIYSAGATLYHLLSGKRPAKDALAVEPLLEENISLLVCRIIEKAMNPNPDLRYQTADEMLEDFRTLRSRDPRVKKQKRLDRTMAAAFAILFAAGVSMSFVGLKRMKTAEEWLKLTEYSKAAFSEGDVQKAVSYALEALPDRKGLLMPQYEAETEKALADALGVYDLADGYKAERVITLPSEPLALAESPDGRNGAAVYAWKLAVFDMATGEIRAELPVEESALSEVHFLDADRLVYAGAEGVIVYDISAGKNLWTGEKATALSVSGDGKWIAAVYKTEPYAVIYDAQTGAVRERVDFAGRSQQVTANDRFVNPHDNLFCLNEDGTFLGVSFQDGSLEVMNLEYPDDTLVLYEAGSGYSHFEGGFYQKYFAFSASGNQGSQFAVIDTEAEIQTGGFDSQSPFGVYTDEDGICVQTENLLVQIDPETGEQKPLVTLTDLIDGFTRDGERTLITAGNQVQFYDRSASLVTSFEKETGNELLQMAGGKALIGNSDSPSLRVIGYEDHKEQEIFSYDPLVKHDEARVSADGNTILLFQYDRFNLYDRAGNQLAEVAIPDADQVYDQQYRREDGKSWLEVIYNDGKIREYSAADGTCISEKQGEKPDVTLTETFETSRYRIESPLHGTPVAYDKKSGKQVRRLAEDAYLTYITETGDNIVAQYVTVGGTRYGELLNQQCEPVAELPWLCDVVDDTLIFDYPSGNMRESRIYNIHELKEIAREE